MAGQQEQPLAPSQHCRLPAACLPAEVHPQLTHRLLPWRPLQQALQLRPVPSGPAVAAARCWRLSGRHPQLPGCRAPSAAAGWVCSGCAAGHPPAARCSAAAGPAARCSAAATAPPPQCAAASLSGHPAAARHGGPAAGAGPWSGSPGRAPPRCRPASRPWSSGGGQEGRRADAARRMQIGRCRSGGVLTQPQLHRSHVEAATHTAACCKPAEPRQPFVAKLSLA